MIVAEDFGTRLNLQFNSFGAGTAATKVSGEIAAETIQFAVTADPTCNANGCLFVDSGNNDTEVRGRSAGTYHVHDIGGGNKFIVNLNTSAAVGSSTIVGTTGIGATTRSVVLPRR
jgi:hypothetical protein